MDDHTIAMDKTTTFEYIDLSSLIDEECKKDYVAKVGSIAVPTFLTIVVVLSLFGNILVLVILGLYETLKSTTNIFILNLALSDLMFTLGLPFWASYYIWGWRLGDVVCKGVNFIFIAGFYSSIIFLLAMTVQRYMAVVHPLSDWERGQQCTFLPALIWLFSFLAALPSMLKSGVIEQDGKSFCEYNDPKVTIAITYIHNFFFIFSFTVMSFCYIRILQTVLKSRRNKRHKTIRLIFCIVAVFFVGWAPYNVVRFLKSLEFFHLEPFIDCEFSKSLDYVEYACKLMAFSHCCLNPLFYVFVGVKFRNHLKEVLHKIFHRRRDTDVPQGRTVPSQGSLY